MRRSTVVIELVGNAALARDLAAGGVFVPGCALGITEECELVVCGADRRLSVPARVVYVDEQRGAGLELIGFSTAMREQLAELAPVAEPAPVVEPAAATALTGLTALDDDDDLAVPVASDPDEDDRTVPVSTAVRDAASPAPIPDDDLAVPIADDGEDDHLTQPVSTGDHAAIRAELAEDGRAPNLAASLDAPAPIPEIFAFGRAHDPGAATNNTGAPTDRAGATPDRASATPDDSPGRDDGDCRGDARLPDDFHEPLRGLILAQVKLATRAGAAHDTTRAAESAARAAEGTADRSAPGAGPDSAGANDDGGPEGGDGGDSPDSPDSPEGGDGGDSPDSPDSPDDGDGGHRGEARMPRNVHERLRGLTLAAQLKLATSGELHERIVLERLYGKNVWETLLRNPRLTPPEVSRIARYGSLPRVLLEIILANNTWLQVPEVRRAVLTNPRLATDQIVRVLRLVPKHELRLAAIQTAYPHTVRNAARMLLRGE